MTSNTEFDAFVSFDNNIPEEWEEARDYLIDQIREMTEGINARDYAYYVQKETLTGGKFIQGTANPPAFRSIFRKVIPTGTLPDNSTITVAHGITTNTNTCFIRINGAATDPGATTIDAAIPLPYVDEVAPDQNVQISLDDTNIMLESQGDYSTFTKSFIILEWIQEP